MSLEGMFAHTFDDQGDVKYQIKIIKPVDDMVNNEGTAWLCLLHSWLTGHPTEYFVTTTITIIREGWRLYDDVQDWQESGDRLSKKSYLRSKRKDQSQSDQLRQPVSLGDLSEEVGDNG